MQAWGEDMGHIILGDRGGPGLPFLVLIVMPIALWWLGRRVIRSRPLPFALPLPASLAIVALPVALLAVVTFVKQPGGSRKLRIRPEVMTLYSEVKADMLGAARPNDLPALARDYQAAWYSRSGDSAWRFVDPERPLIREPLVPAAPKADDRWNVLFLQLEGNAWQRVFIDAGVVFWQTVNGLDSPDQDRHHYTLTDLGAAHGLAGRPLAGVTSVDLPSGGELRLVFAGAPSVALRHVDGRSQVVVG